MKVWKLGVIGLLAMAANVVGFILLIWIVMWAISFFNGG